jgi:hypothetical protein
MAIPIASAVADRIPASITSFEGGSAHDARPVAPAERQIASKVVRMKIVMIALPI